MNLMVTADNFVTWFNFAKSTKDFSSPRYRVNVRFRRLVLFK